MIGWSYLFGLKLLEEDVVIFTAAERMKRTGGTSAGYWARKFKKTGAYFSSAASFVWAKSDPENPSMNKIILRLTIR